MRILHINSYYSIGEFYRGLFDQQIKAGHTIRVFVPVPHGFKRKFDYDGYAEVVEVFSRIDRLFFHVKHQKILQKIRKCCHIPDYHIIHAHSLFSNGYIAYKLNKEYGVPFIVAVRDTDVNVFFKRMIHLRGLGVKILDSAKVIVFLSEPYKDITISKYVPKHMQKEMLRKSYVIPNGIDSYWLENINLKKIEKSDESISILQVGEITKRKNALATAHAVEILNNQGHNAKFAIVGALKNKAIFDKLITFPFVSYLGVQAKEELLHTYRKSDIFVMPSLTETFGLVYAEAMSQGLPVIYTRGQGFDGQFEEGVVGYSVDSKSPDDIARKMKMVLNCRVAVSERCTDLSKRYNWEVIANEYQQLYSRVV